MALTLFAPPHKMGTIVRGPQDCAAPGRWKEDLFKIVWILLHERTRETKHGMRRRIRERGHGDRAGTLEVMS